jgi:hypothetical protein
VFFVLFCFFFSDQPCRKQYVWCYLPFQITTELRRVPDPPPAVTRPRHELESLTHELATELEQLMNERAERLAKIDADPLDGAEGRMLFVKFFTDPKALVSVVEEMEGRVKALAREVAQRG